MEVDSVKNILPKFLSNGITDDTLLLNNVLAVYAKISDQPEEVELEEEISENHFIFCICYFVFCICLLSCFGCILTLQDDWSSSRTKIKWYSYR
jgi:hypothetical protein